jgi:uncharacterized protein (TIGR02266 family)
VRESAHQSAPWDVEPASLVREFLPLNRRRIHGNPPLERGEVARWEELRDLLEIALRAVPVAPGESRRRSLRVRTHLKVLVTNPLAQELLLVHDLSEQGVFLRTQRPAAPGSLLQLEFRDRNGRTIELEGSVVWARRVGEGYCPCGMGVAFHALSAWDRSALCELVEATLVALD